MADKVDKVLRGLAASYSTASRSTTASRSPSSDTASRPSANSTMASRPSCCTTASRPSSTFTDSGPVVTRRIGPGISSASKNTQTGSSASSDVDSRPSAASTIESESVVPKRVGPGLPTVSQSCALPRVPSIRQTIESMTSSGSQCEFLKPEQTIILFDWDDTLCPSHWIRDNQPTLSFFRPAPNDEKYRKPLRELQANVEAVLKLAMKMGRVVIVTNAMEPWVEVSCRNFLPMLIPLVTQIPVVYARSVFDTIACEPSKNKVPTAVSRAASGESREAPSIAATATTGSGSSVLSGRSTPSSPCSVGRLQACAGPPSGGCGQAKLANYNAKLSLQTNGAATPQPWKNPQRWKELVFEQEITGFYSRYAHQSWKNIISIGDSVFERDAVRRVVLNRPNSKRTCRTKTTKLLDDPDIDELISEVRVVHDALGSMVQYDGNLNIELDEEDLKLDMLLEDKIMA